MPKKWWWEFAAGVEWLVTCLSHYCKDQCGPKLYRSEVWRDLQWTSHWTSCKKFTWQLLHQDRNCQKSKRRGKPQGVHAICSGLAPVVWICSQLSLAEASKDLWMKLKCTASFQESFSWWYVARPFIMHVLILILRRVLQIMFITLRNNFQLLKILFEKWMLKVGSMFNNGLANTICRINTFPWLWPGSSHLIQKSGSAS